MTVNNEASSVAYTGNGVATVFPYTFRIPESDMGHVGVLDIASSSLTELSPSDYIITGIGSEFGGSVTYNPSGVPLPNTKRIVIYRDLALVQELDLTNQTPYYADTLEDTLDRIVMMMQQVSADVSRAIKTTLGSGTSPDELVEDLLGVQAAASASANAAALSAASALTSETNADDSELLAYKWATNPEDVVVTGGLYSAFHWARKAATLVTANFIAAISSFAAKATPADADLFGYRQVSDSTGRNFTWANAKAALLTAFNLNFPRYDIAQPVSLTNAQKLQLLTNVGSPFKLGFLSAQQAIVLTGGLAIPHGLATAPILVTAVLHCTGAHGGYSVGDEIAFAFGASATYVATDSNSALWVDATNINVRFAARIDFGHKTTGLLVNIDVTKWTLIVRAWA